MTDSFPRDSIAISRDRESWVVRLFSAKLGTPKKYKVSLFNVARAVKQLMKKMVVGSQEEQQVGEEIKDDFKGMIPSKVVGLVIQRSYFSIDSY